jgi:hypothetical protein
MTRKRKSLPGPRQTGRRKSRPDESNREAIEAMLQHAYEFALTHTTKLPQPAPVADVGSDAVRKTE